MKYFCVLFIFLFISCSQSKKEKTIIIIKEFPQEVTLKGTYLKVPPVLLKPRCARIIDSFLVVSQKTPDSIFTIFSLPDCQLIKSFGRIGKGPKEFVSPTPATLSANNGGFCIKDRQLRIRFFRLKDILANKMEAYKTIICPPKLSIIKLCICSGDSLLIGNSYNNDIDDELYIFNLNTKELSSLVKYPETYPLMSNIMKGSTYMQLFILKPDNKKLATEYYNEKKIRIYNLITKDYVELKYKDSPTFSENLGLTSTSKEHTNKHEKKFFYSTIDATDKYIYANMFDEELKIIHGDNEDAILSELHVFDWTGKPMAKYKFDEQIGCYAVTRDDRYLYAISDFKKDIIIRYNLPKLLP